MSLTIHLRQAINDISAEPKKRVEYWDARNRGKKKTENRYHHKKNND